MDIVQESSQENQLPPPQLPPLSPQDPPHHRDQPPHLLLAHVESDLEDKELWEVQMQRSSVGPGRCLSRRQMKMAAVSMFVEELFSIMNTSSQQLTVSTNTFSRFQKLIALVRVYLVLSKVQDLTVVAGEYNLAEESGSEQRLGISEIFIRCQHKINIELNCTCTKLF